MPVVLILGLIMMVVSGLLVCLALSYCMFCPAWLLHAEKGKK